MCDKLLVSIIVPVYNVERFLKQALDSIVYQSYHNIEVIIIDDGSTDTSGRISDKYAEQYKNFKVYHIENCGLAEARNFGLKLAHGEFIYFMDPDDWIEKNLIESAVTALERDKTNVFLLNFRLVSESGAIISGNDKLINNINSIETDRSIIKKLARNELHNFVWQFIVRSSVIKDIGPLLTFQNMAYEDITWTPIVIQRAKHISVSNQYFYNYRQRSNSIAHTQSLKNIQDRKKARSFFNKFISENYAQLQDELVASNIDSLLHLYSMCANFEGESSEIKKIQTFIEQQLKQVKNTQNIEFKNRLKVLLFRIGLLMPILKLVRYLKK